MIAYCARHIVSVHSIFFELLHLSLRGSNYAMRPSTLLAILLAIHHSLSSSSTQQHLPTGTQTQPPSPSISDTPPHKYPAYNPHPLSPSHPTPPSAPYSHPPSSVSSSPQIQLGTQHHPRWRRGRLSGCGCGAAFGFARCESGWNVWDAGECGGRRG